ncbi:MAG: XDD3 family exosortase-dependent surface protein [Microcoleaceae cyanobacterium]
MMIRNIKKIVGTVAATACLSLIVGQTAQAGQLHNGWNYSIDSFSDGSGGVDYEIKGLAVTESEDSIIVGLSGGMSWDENSDNITWGDLFFNFSGDDFNTASQNGDLFGIKFANNDTDLQLGVYKDVTASTITNADHDMYSSLKQYYDYGWNRQDTMGTDISTKAEAYDYLGKGAFQHVIGSGERVGEINKLNGSQLANMGLDFGHFSANAPQVFGFEFSKSLVQNGDFESGDYLAHLFMECGNDGVALAGNIEDIPEPTTLGGLAIVGLALAGRRKLKNGKNA